MSKLIDDLVNKIDKDIPNERFTIEDVDEYVILGKINEVINNLVAIRNLVNDSDSKAVEALDNSITALRNSQQALEASTNALNSSNTALESANTALSTANSAKTESADANSKATTALSNSDMAISDSAAALEAANASTEHSTQALAAANAAQETAKEANTTSGSALSKAEDAFNTSNSAEDYAVNADSNASTALDNSKKAVTDAANALIKAQEALDKVVEGVGTTIKDYSGNKLATATFKGSNTIVVDLAETNPNEFVFTLDQKVIDAINNATTNIITITNNINSINGKIGTINQNITNLTNNKQDNLTAEELANIAAVPNKQDKLSEAQITNINNVPNKQNKLTAGANIKIEGDTISASGGGSKLLGTYTISNVKTEPLSDGSNRKFKTTITPSEALPMVEGKIYAIVIYVDQFGKTTWGNFIGAASNNGYALSRIGGYAGGDYALFYPVAFSSNVCIDSVQSLQNKITNACVIDVYEI